MYKSHIETYLKSKRLTTENKVLRVLYHEGIQFVDIKIYDINEYNHYKDFEDAKKIISDLEFKYIKDESDSIYRKMKVGDMRFDIDDYLRVIYKLPKDEVDKRIKEVYTYTYDHAGRAMKTTHSVNGSTEVTLADNSYDTLGRLSNKVRGGNGMLSMAYTYNVRSWMTGMSGSLFSESLYYTDNPYNTGNRHYGGNISAMGWKAGQTQRAYDLSYDNLSRLTGAKYYETNANGRYSTQYTYDSMGNILTLKRNGLQDGGTYGLVDNLTYTYNGNQLTKISDSVEDPTYVGAFNFKDGANTGSEYAYDANGNMTADKNKGISSITYNTINLPQKITFSDGKTTEYVYSYDGTKLQTKHTTSVPQTSTTTTYSGNLIYENGALKRLLVDGGYVTFNGTTPKYHFYIQDHLGNNRVVADEGGNIEQINHYYPYGGLMADISTNSDAQPYKYNGKELDRMHGLDLYDYGARHYDAAIGRWPTMDALAEKNPEVSPYVYCHNNPVNNIDPDGRFTTEWLAEFSRNWYNMWHSTKAGPVIRNTDATDSRFSYTYNTFSFDDGEFTVTSNYKFSTESIETVQNIGDAMTLAGVTATSTVIGAEIGAPLLEVGSIISGTGGLLKIGLNLINGDYQEAGISAVFMTLGKGIHSSLKNVVAGYGKKFGDDGFNAGATVLEKGVDLKVSLTEKVVDTILDKEKEDDELNNNQR